ncbi:thioesterase family protein [Spirillospora sp. NPDC047279]|uniref:thioesterase family protein n=1 Tax=Spirillospora sp. NPDC047279 TaxID=3155478 RepID=UPI00340FAC54
MGDLASDTAVSGDNGHYTAKLSSDWSAWGPVGGYVAAVLCRAALAHGTFSRVASVTCHFLAVAAFAPVDLDVVTLRRTRRAESIRVTMTQDGRTIAEALCWLADGDLPGLAHDTARLARMPARSGLLPLSEVWGDGEEIAPIWHNIEARPVIEETPGHAYASGWYRFRAPADETARELVLLDVLPSSAAWNAHGPGNGFLTPNLDLAVQFHRAAPAGGWLYAEAHADVAEDGLIGFRSRVWTEDRRLLASGSGQLLCRPE